MPFFFRERKLKTDLAREAERFARLVRTIPVTRDAPSHPEVREMIASFKRINTHLAARNKEGEVTLAQKVRIGREFQRMGAALRKRRAAKN